MTSLHILSVRLEASTVAASSTATLSTVPTEYRRSPGTFLSYDAWQVNPSGNVYYGGSNVYDSYGRVQSPNTNITTRACFVNPYGDVISGYYVDSSYGSPDRRLTDNGYFCNQYGYIAYDDYGVQYSYGVFSPSMTLSNYAWHGKPSGDVYYNDGDDVDSSYGYAGHIYGRI